MENNLKTLEWYRAFEESVMNDHRTYSFAVSHANIVCGISKADDEGEEIIYPYNEGDTYYAYEVRKDGNWDISESCWDDQSEEFFENDEPYFDSMEEGIQYAKGQKIRELHLTYFEFSSNKILLYNENTDQYFNLNNIDERY